MLARDLVDDDVGRSKRLGQRNAGLSSRISCRQSERIPSKSFESNPTQQEAVMNQKAVLHKGLLADCKVCNPTTETQEKRSRKTRSKTGVSLDVVIRRQVAFDLGEDE